MMEAVIERCAGVDVGKKFVVVCLMVGSLESEPKTELRKSGRSCPNSSNYEIGHIVPRSATEGRG